jgi:hypothetical protein
MCIFEIAEQQEVESQSEEKDPEPLLLLSPDQRQGETRIASDRQQKNPKVALVPPAVKEQRSSHQDGHSGPAAPKTDRHKIGDANRWKKAEDELIRVEQHRCCYGLRIEYRLRPRPKAR